VLDSSARAVDTGGEEVELSSLCPSQSNVTDRNDGSGADKQLFLIYETLIDVAGQKIFAQMSERTGQCVVAAVRRSMERPSRDIASIVIAVLVGLVVVLALYFFFFAGSMPTARPPL
jgi:hypothetical protein